MSAVIPLSLLLCLHFSWGDIPLAFAVEMYVVERANPFRFGDADLQTCSTGFQCFVVLLGLCMAVRVGSLHCLPSHFLFGVIDEPKLDAHTPCVSERHNSLLHLLSLVWIFAFCIFVNCEHVVCFTEHFPLHNNSHLVYRYVYYVCSVWTLAFCLLYSHNDFANTFWPLFQKVSLFVIYLIVCVGPSYHGSHEVIYEDPLCYHCFSGVCIGQVQNRLCMRTTAISNSIFRKICFLSPESHDSQLLFSLLALYELYSLFCFTYGAFCTLGCLGFPHLRVSKYLQNAALLNLWIHQDSNNFEILYLDLQNLPHIEDDHSILVFDCTFGFPGEGPWSITSANIDSFQTHPDCVQWDSDVVAIQETRLSSNNIDTARSNAAEFGRIFFLAHYLPKRKTSMASTKLLMGERHLLRTLQTPEISKMKKMRQDYGQSFKPLPVCQQYGIR